MSCELRQAIQSVLLSGHFCIKRIAAGGSGRFKLKLQRLCVSLLSGPSYSLERRCKCLGQNVQDLVISCRSGCLHLETLRFINSESPNVFMTTGAHWCPQDRGMATAPWEMGGTGTLLHDKYYTALPLVRLPVYSAQCQCGYK